ncbi:hypothetical protein [Endozoicomonas arenosclerae]|uniref:hypothetical protein n=1 Tax=Endozoicomonas arenosclerae TaxID=1633495 RepID=UPI000784B024|nr:hypothetical protein [Endozoicomonas arenosclerae]
MPKIDPSNNHVSLYGVTSDQKTDEALDKDKTGQYQGRSVDQKSIDKALGQDEWVQLPEDAPRTQNLSVDNSSKTPGGQYKTHPEGLGDSSSLEIQPLKYSDSNGSTELHSNDSKKEHYTKERSESLTQSEDIESNQDKPSSINFFRGIYHWVRYLLWPEKVDSSYMQLPHLKSRVKDLMKACKPGRSIILNHGSGLHTAMLVWNPELGKPVYLSYRHDYKPSLHQVHSNLLKVDLVFYNRGRLQASNVVIIDGLDEQALFKRFNQLTRTPYRALSCNCSRFIADLMIAGCLKTQSFRHDRYWQMPFNTHQLALEIKHKLLQK